MKCPSCAATVGALDRVCPYCGVEIPAATMASVAAASIEAVPAPLTAAAISEKIQENLTALAQQPPITRARAIIIGLITPPTLGIAFLVYKALEMFGKRGETANRLILSIDENIRKGKTAYKHDPDIMASFKKYEAELESYHSKRHSSRMAFLASCAVSVALIVVLVLAGWMMAKKEANRKSEDLVSTITRIQSGDLPAALAIMSNLKSDERRELADRDAFAKIPLAILNGQDSEALDLAKGIPDPDSRTKAISFIGQRMVDSLLKASDYDGALKAAALLSPEDARYKAEDSIRVRQATDFIASNKMDEAKKVIEDIRDESIRLQLSGMIKAKLPKADLNGF